MESGHQITASIIIARAGLNLLNLGRFKFAKDGSAPIETGYPEIECPDDRPPKFKITSWERQPGKSNNDQRHDN